MFSRTRPRTALADSTPRPSFPAFHAPQSRLGWARYSNVEAREGRAQCQAATVSWLQNWHFIRATAGTKRMGCESGRSIRRGMNSGAVADSSPTSNKDADQHPARNPAGRGAAGHRASGHAQVCVLAHLGHPGSCTQQRPAPKAPQVFFFFASASLDHCSAPPPRRLLTDHVAQSPAGAPSQPPVVSNVPQLLSSLVESLSDPANLDGVRDWIDHHTSSSSQPPWCIDQQHIYVR